MPRTTLDSLIQRLRGMVNAGEAYYRVGTANYWDNEQLQLVLDRHRVDIDRELLTPVVKHLGGGSVSYLEYRSGFENFESTSGGSAIFVIEDATGADIGTAAYSVDYQLGIVTFASDTGGSARYLNGRSFNLNAAAADVWRMKAGHIAENAYDVSTDNHSLSRSQKLKNCLAMAELYEARIGFGQDNTVTLFRSDVAP